MFIVPNIKSAIKRVSVNRTKKEQNRGLKTELATVVKNFKAAVEAGELEKAEQMYPATVGVIDNARLKGIIKPNTADRKKSRLAVMLNKKNSK